MRVNLIPHSWLVFSQPLLVVFSAGLCFTWLAVHALAIPPGPAGVEESRQKLASEISAVESVALRAQILKSAEQDAHGHEIANWYAGKIKQQGEWVSLDAARQHASEDSRLAEYQLRRANLTDNIIGHEKLARWCKKQALTDQANVHWLHVLRLRPQHRVALHELELSWYRGQLLASDEVEGYQAKEKEFQKRKKRWRSKAARLRRDLEQGEPAERLAARKELREAREPAAVPALLDEFAEEGATEEQTIDRQIELMAILGSIDAPEAVDTLLGFAVRSQNDAVRYAALDELKAKPIHQYVPTLLAELKLPVEASVSIYSVGNRIVNNYSYSQEGPGEQEYEHSYQSSRTIPGRRFNRTPTYRSQYIRHARKEIRAARDIPEIYHPAYRCGTGMVPAHTHAARRLPEIVREAYTEEKKTRVGTAISENSVYQLNKQQTGQKSQADAANVDRQIAEFNQAAEIQNQQIVDVLTEVTGETLDVFPKSWWNWWRGYLDNHPDVATAGARQQLNAALLNQSPRGLSRGTWIWTLEGLRAVETILPGDYVLAQDPDSGELAYKVVLAIDVPRQLAVTKLDIARSSVHCASGHVVWRSGTGWRRVSKLAASDSLHGVKAELQLERSAESFSIDCYDLIVDGFHTFFVGESGILAHDATPIKPTYVALPGISAATVANAVRLVAAADR